MPALRAVPTWLTHSYAASFSRQTLRMANSRSSMVSEDCRRTWAPVLHTISARPGLCMRTPKGPPTLAQHADDLVVLVVALGRNLLLLGDQFNSRHLRSLSQLRKC